MKLLNLTLRSIAPVCLAAGIATAQPSAEVDPEALIEQILAVEARQLEHVSDVVFEAEYLEGKSDEKKGFQEEARFIKKVYIKYAPDTTWFKEEYLEYYEKGELQSPEKRDKKAKERLEKSRKRKARNISYPMLKPFYRDQRDNYEITYGGVADEKMDGYVCHHFSVRAGSEQDDLINGEYYFEAESFNLVRVDFSPAKLVKKLMFRLKKLRMSILYAPGPDGYWFPKQFDIRGKGKAAFLFGVNFAGTEYYRNPRINNNLSVEFFQEDHDTEQ